MIYTVVCPAQHMVYSILCMVYTISFIPRYIPPIYTMPCITVYTMVYTIS